MQYFCPMIISILLALCTTKGYSQEYMEIIKTSSPAIPNIQVRYESGKTKALRDDQNKKIRTAARALEYLNNKGWELVSTSQEVNGYPRYEMTVYLLKRKDQVQKDGSK